MKRILFIFVLFLVLPSALPAQDGNFSVHMFRRLDWDLDARVNYPKKDQNGEKAALIKVMASDDGYSFDVGMIGVVAVEKKLCEIWVYVPEGIRKITISNPEYGVIRDWNFPIPIEAACVYELTLELPRKKLTADPVVLRDTVVRDSLVYVPVEAQRSAAMSGRDLHALATYSVRDNAFGVMAAWYRKAGFYLRYETNFNDAEHSYECSTRRDYSDYGYIWTNGRSKVSYSAFSGGGVVRLCGFASMYAGMGYGSRTLLWQDEQGKYMKVTDCSHRGIVFDAGFLLRMRRLDFSVGTSSVAFSTSSVYVGVGLNF